MSFAEVCLLCYRLWTVVVVVGHNFVAVLCCFWDVKVLKVKNWFMLSLNVKWSKVCTRDKSRTGFCLPIRVVSSVQLLMEQKWSIWFPIRKPLKYFFLSYFVKEACWLMDMTIIISHYFDVSVLFAAARFLYYHSSIVW